MRSIKSDMWSYGIFLWELVSLGSNPYENLDSSELYKAVLGGQRLVAPSWSSPTLMSLFVRCWDVEPARRPTAWEAEVLLRAASDALAVRKASTEDLAPTESRTGHWRSLKVRAWVSRAVESLSRSHRMGAVRNAYESASMPWS